MTFLFWLFFAMLIPVWIPVITVVAGGIADAVQRHRGVHALTGAAAIVAQLQTSDRAEHTEALAA